MCGSCLDPVLNKYTEKDIFEAMGQDWTSTDSKFYWGIIGDFVVCENDTVIMF